MKYSKVEQEVIFHAKSIIESRWSGICEPNSNMSSPRDMIDYMICHFADRSSYEVFSVIYLTTQHDVILVEDLFRGTIDGAAIYPREVIRRALELNAAAMIFAHNHPSGTPEPSGADKRITERLKSAAAMVDMRILDHLIISGVKHYSFAEGGLL